MKLLIILGICLIGCVFAVGIHPGAHSHVQTASGTGLVVSPVTEQPSAPLEEAQPAHSVEDAIDNLAKILLELPEPEPELGASAETLSKMSPADKAALIRRVWAHRQALLKQAFESIKSDAQFMSELLSRLMSPDNETESSIVTILEDLEFHVSNADNAADFTKVSIRIN